MIIVVDDESIYARSLMRHLALLIGESIAKTPVDTLEAAERLMARYIKHVTNFVEAEKEVFAHLDEIDFIVMDVMLPTAAESGIDPLQAGVRLCARVLGEAPHFKDRMVLISNLKKEQVQHSLYANGITHLVESERIVSKSATPARIVAGQILGWSGPLRPNAMDLRE